MAVASGSEDVCSDTDTYQIQLTDLNSNKESWLSGHDCPVVSIDFNADGKKLVSSDIVGKIIIWDVLNQSALFGITTTVSTSTMWKPTEDLILEQNEFSVYITDQTRNYISTQKSPNGSITIATWNTDGSKVAFSDTSGAVLIWDFNKDSIELTANIHSNAVVALDWNPVNQTIASADESGDLIFWNALTGQIVTSISNTTRVNDLEWSPDGEVLASAGEDGIVRVWKIEAGDNRSQPTLRLLTSYDYQSPVYAVAWRPDGSQIAYGGLGIDDQDGQVEISTVDIPSQTPVPSLTATAAP